MTSFEPFVSSDPFSMSTFNTKLGGAFGKVDADVSATQSLIKQRGDCFVEFGSYTGSGDRTKTMTFSHKPILVIIHDVSSSLPFCLTMIQGAPNANGYENSSSAVCNLSWSGNSVTFANNASSSYAYNGYNKSYFYAAVLKGE